jgi:hypothetical protein
MRLYHCAPPEAYEDIKSHGLRRMGCELFSWPTQEAAHEWREKIHGGWRDVWAFDDRGESRCSPGTMYAGVEGRVLDRDVPPEDLEPEPVYKAR